MGANVNAAGVAQNMPNFVRQIQRERMGRQQMAPSNEAPADPMQFQALLNQAATNGQEQNAAPTSGALQKEGGQEGGRQRNVGQGKEEGSLGQSSQVQRAKERQQGQQMR